MTTQPHKDSLLGSLRGLTRRLLGADEPEEARPDQREMAQRVLRRLKTGEIKVPIFPVAAQRTTELINNPNARVTEIASIIETDAALCAELLRVANSAAFSGGTEIRTVQRAIAQLGLNKLRSLLFVVIRRAMFPRSAFKELHTSYFNQAMAVACACEALEPLLGLSEEGSFLFGILHNIGRSGMLNVITEMQNADELPRDLTLAEVERLVSHTYEPCGAIIARKWRLPDEFQRVIFHHRSPDRLDASVRLPTLLTYLAIELCVSHRVGGFSRAIGVHINDCPHIQRLALDPHTLNRAAAKAKVQYTDLRGCF